MQIEFLIAKINATVTQSSIHYEGSITIDEDIMDRAGIYEYQAVFVNNPNGNRNKTYVLKGKRGSGIIGINGALSPLHKVGDKIHINAFGFYKAKWFKTINVNDLNPIIINI